MSAFDLPKIVESLRLRKVKQRNDAIQLLRSFSPSKLRLTPRHFVVLLDGLLKLIEIEREAYGSNSTPATQQRLLTASTILKDVLEESLKRNQLRYKHCTALVSNIMPYFFLPDTRSILAPCAIDFARILNILLQEQFFITHLSLELWNKCYKFLISLLTASLEMPDTSHYQFSHESLLTDLLNSLHSLLGGNTNDIYEPIKDLKTYVPLRKILRDVFELHNKRESPVLVEAFKITNKLLMSISTEDSIFCNKIIHTALHPLINFAHTTVDSLLTQFVIFINLESFYRYLDVTHLPRLISADNIEEGASFGKRRDPFINDSMNDMSAIYNVNVLAQALLNRIINLPSKLSKEDVGFIERTKTQNWFELYTIQLQTQNDLLWLLYLGTSRLIAKYYEMSSKSGSSNVNHSFKRLKLQSSILDITTFSHIDQLLEHMGNYSSDVKIQICGLQLLAFTKDFSATHSSHDKKESSVGNVAEDITISHDETTVINLNLDEENDTGKDCNILSCIIKNFNNKALTYWCLLNTFVLLRRFNLARSHEDRVISRRLHQIVKLITPLVKQDELSQLACRLFSFIVFSCDPDRLYRIIDSSIVTQLESIIDLAEISGPSSIHGDAACFWWALHWAMTKLTNVRATHVSKGAGRWLLSKLNDEFLERDGTGARYLNSYHARSDLLPSFILWLQGHDIPDTSCDFMKSSGKSYASPLATIYKPDTDFDRFLALEEPPLQQKVHKVHIMSCHGNDLLVSSVVSKILEIGTFVMNKSENVPEVFLWAQLVSNITHRLKSVNSTMFPQLNEMKEKLWRTLFMNLTGQEDFISIVRALASDTAKEVLTVDLHLICRHLEQFFFGLSSFSQIPGSHGTSDTEFDEEFLNTDSKKALPIARSPSMESAAKISYFRFLVMYDGESSSLLRILDESDSSTVVECLSVLLESNFVNVIDPKFASRILRILGEGPLSSHLLDRTSKTISVTCKLLRTVVPLTKESEHVDLCKDVSDLLGFLLQCEEKSLFLVEDIRRNVVSLFLDTLSLPNLWPVSGNDALSRALLSASNSLKASLLASVAFHLSSLDSIGQMDLYRLLFETFLHPQASVERAATYCYFFATVSANSSQVTIPALFNLLECSKYGYFEPYLKRSIRIISGNGRIDAARQLFLSLRLELLKSWWLYGIPLDSFPYGLFDYNDFKVFTTENYKQIMSITMAIKSERTEAQALSQLTQVAKLKGDDIQSLLYDSLPLVIPLAYTSDGVRNEVFKALLPHLNNLYKSYMREKVLLIVLETLRLTDTGSEASLKEVCGEFELKNIFKSGLIIDNSMRATVTPISSVDLIRALISKFWTSDRGEFWTKRVCYFILRQLGRDVHKEDTETKVLAIRKIKFMMCQSRFQMKDPEMVTLLVDIILPLIPTIAANEASTLLAIIPQESVRAMGKEVASITFSRVLSALFDNPSNATSFKPYLLDLKKLCFNEGSDIFGAYATVLSKSIDKILGNRIEASGGDFSTILDNISTQPYPQHHIYIIIGLLMRLYHDVTIPAPENTSTSVVKLFLNIDFLQNRENNFGNWVARYLSFFYLNNSQNGDITDLSNFLEFESISKDNFVNSSSSMNFFVEQLLELRASEDYESQSFADCILGALVWKFELRKDDTSKFIDFQDSYMNIREYVMPLDMHSCLVAVSSSDQLTIGTESLVQLVESLPYRIAEASFLKWSSQLSLGVLQEIAKYTSIAPLFATCIIKFPHLAHKTLPYLLCYYITLMGSRTVEVIGEILTAMRKSVAHLGQEGLDVFARIVLNIRVGSKQEGSPFQQIYSALDKTDVFLVLKESSYAKTSLMIFEDATNGKPQNVEWDKWRTSLIKIYESIDDLDMLYGVPEDSSLSNAMQMLERTGSASDILRNNLAYLDVAASTKGTEQFGNTMNALLDDGLMGMSKLVSSTSKETSGNFEWSWKLNLWDLPFADEPSSDHELIYNYLKRIHSLWLVPQAFATGIGELFAQKQNILHGNMSFKSSRELLQRWFVSLSCMTEVEDILNASNSLVTNAPGAFKTISSWFVEADMVNLENILLCRREAFRMKIDESNSTTTSLLQANPVQDACWQGLIYDVLTYNAVARLNKHSQKMLNSAVLMDDLVKSSQLSAMESWESIKKFATFSIAQTLWAQGNTSAPIAMLKSLARHSTPGSSESLLHIDSKMITSQLVQWLAESREELGKRILEHYVSPIEDSMTEMENSTQRSKSYLLLAKFCEQQFKATSLESQIDGFKQRMKSKKDEIEVIKSHYGKTAVTPSERRSVQKYYNRLKSQVASDAIELESLEDTKMTFACKGATFYLNALLAGDALEESVDRFISLFLELSWYEPLQKSLKHDLQSLPSYKSLSWSTQLMARLSNEKNDFQESVQLLIMRICFDHPYHSLYMLFSLLYHKEVAEETSNSTMLLRVTAAEKVKENLISKSQKFAEETLLPIEKLCDASIALAKLKSSKGRALHLDKLEIGTYWLHDLPHIPPPAVDLPVLPEGYKNAPRMVSMDPKVSIATSGLSLPKIAQFTLSDGTSRKMLLKYGTDDLRQDATMEQVFEKVNSILQRDRDTRKRNLRIRTYKAIPLGPKAGLIEFVPNSKALIEVVRPYHQKVDLMKYEKAKEAMKECQSSTMKERLQAYETIIKKINPVLHLYFSDHFLSPDTWYNSRQRYTRGIASSSMVGHILGLGDRHCNNILLEESTGEPVHIDLGVAFDQGKRLPIPETVPFRLTRDIVDGFGFTGVHGVFDKLCEHTFRVLREHKEHIIAILDALRWDPLYLWSISPLRKKRLQDESKTLVPEPQEDGSEANAAVLTVIEKLNAGGLSVEATVRQLIREATSAENLALIYCGWCPFF